MTAPLTEHPALQMPREQLSGRIQHTLIGQAITERQVRAHVQEALTHGFDAAIVPPCWVWAARAELRGTVARIGSIVDYPNGSALTSTRVAEVKALVDAGVDELDATVNVGYLLSGRTQEFAADLAAVVTAAEPIGVKLMLELPLLTTRQREQAVTAAVDAGRRIRLHCLQRLGRDRGSGDDRLPAEVGSGLDRGEGIRRSEDGGAGQGAIDRGRRSDRYVGRHPHRHGRRRGQRITVFVLTCAIWWNRSHSGDGCRSAECTGVYIAISVTERLRWGTYQNVTSEVVDRGT